MGLSPFYEVSFKSFHWISIQNSMNKLQQQKFVYIFTCINFNSWCNVFVEYLRSLLYSILSNLFCITCTFANNVVLQDPYTSILYAILEYTNE